MDFDSHKPFIWRKKYEDQGLKVDDKQIEEETRRRIEENKLELERIRERQIKRNLEYQQKLNDNEFLQRQKEVEHHEHWEQQEEEFDLRQRRLRSKIRIRDGRAKPIDLLAYYIDVFGADFDDKKSRSVYLPNQEIDLSDSLIELLDPCEWFNGLSSSDLESLEPDIKVYMNCDNKLNMQYWTDLLDITNCELATIRRSHSESVADAAVLNELISLFDGKSMSELDDIERELTDFLKSDDPSVDPALYQAAILRLRADRARMRLTLNHKKNLKRQKERILKKSSDKPDSGRPGSHDQSIDDKQLSRIKLESQVSEDNPKPEEQRVAGESQADDVDTSDDSEDEDSEVPQELKNDVNPAVKEYEEGNYSPKMCRKSQLEPGTTCVDHDKMIELLAHQRYQVSKASNLDEVKLAMMTNEEKAFIDAAKKDMNTDESVFANETAVRGSDNRPMSYNWSDRYQPRKPRYFNKVHTGFEWNKYNQTHYDIDNPPPKVVQGYKFNIFYPDLIDKTKAPTFTLTPCKDDKDFCVIRFSAGPPYEDIAFRIVNREWNSSHKSGYRCQFSHNTLQLWFQFKRYRYRR